VAEVRTTRITAWRNSPTAVSTYGVGADIGGMFRGLLRFDRHLGRVVGDLVGTEVITVPAGASDALSLAANQSKRPRSRPGPDQAGRHRGCTGIQIHHGQMIAATWSPPKPAPLEWQQN
jgi:hypothetical protein